MKVVLLTLIFLLTSCASYVQQVHRQIDNENRALKSKRYQTFQRAGDRRPIQNPVTLNGVPSANTRRNYNPRVKRDYKGNKRYKANDLLDNGSDGSLWSGQNSDNFLFVTNNLKRKGDIVIIDVYDKLKDKIQEELKRSFPEPKKKKTAKAETKDSESKEAPAATPGGANPDKVHDKISSKVVEIVNKDYIMLRGRKEILFRKQKRYFEIQAIVSQKDITSNDTVESKKILEPRINVLRY